MPSYYNEFDPYAAQWLRNLAAAGHIPPGDVDERDIRDVKPDDLEGYDQHHFFAGIGGWSLALRLAGWPDDRPVWTGSCPCQPLSSAGKREGHADQRHLWPAFHALIAECLPPTVFGEQVASKDGREWLSGVRADLESAGYAVGAADLPAAGCGAPHIRQRLWWVAQSQDRRRTQAAARIHASTDKGRQADRSGDVGTDGGLGDTSDARLQRRELAAACDGDRDRAATHGSAPEPGQVSGAGFWAAHDLIPCADGKSRRVEPGIQPLAHGVPARVGKLRAAGNAIVPQVAAEFVTAWMETGG